MQRILQLDFFRGFFLVVITVNHFLSDDNIIKKLTSGFLGWISAAEGFVFLSGFTVGLIYTYYYQEKGKKFIMKATRQRAWLIYKSHLALFLLVEALLLTIPYFYSYWVTDYHSIYQDPVLATLLASILFYQPSLLDILPMYALFMLLVPPAVIGFSKGYLWPILLSSFIIYLVGTFNLTEPVLARLDWSEYIFMGVFNPLCWQLLFLCGLLAGYLFRKGKFQVIKEQNKIFFVALAISLVFFILKHFHFPIPGLDLNYWTDKEHIRPLRLINFTCLTFLMTFLVFRFKDKFLFRPLCYLGKYSLQVFVFHILLVLVFSPIREPLNEILSIPVRQYYFFPLETLLLIFIILALYLAPPLFNRQQPDTSKMKRL